MDFSWCWRGRGRRSSHIRTRCNGLLNLDRYPVIGKNLCYFGLEQRKIACLVTSGGRDKSDNAVEVIARTGLKSVGRHRNARHYVYESACDIEKLFDLEVGAREYPNSDIPNTCVCVPSQYHGSPWLAERTHLTSPPTRVRFLWGIENSAWCPALQKTQIHG